MLSVEVTQFINIFAYNYMIGNLSVLQINNYQDLSKYENVKVTIIN